MVAAGLSSCPTLVLHARDGSAGAAAEDLARWRGAGGTAASVPVARLVDVPAQPFAPWHAGGFDAEIGTTWTAARQAAAIVRWRRADVAAPLARLEAAFGAGEVRSLLLGLRRVLVEALAALARERPRDVAHGVAGMAGMLGFAVAGRAWRACDEGRTTDPQALHRHTRVALATIDTILAPGAATGTSLNH